MRATEFVKKYGKAVAVNLCNKSRGCKLSEVLFYDSKNDKYECVDSEELKQIVDAWDLVEARGGIDKTKDRIDWAIANKNFYAADMMKHAINLVEQCQND